jgi:hypothetical protein
VSRFIPSIADASTATVSLDVEAIVRRVLEQLVSEPMQVPVSSAPSESTSTFGLSTRVISLEELKTVPSTVNTLHVGVQSVVTPAARDELRRRGINLSRGEIVSTIDAPKKNSDAGSRAIHLQRDGDVSDGQYAAVIKQVTGRGVRMCSKASLSVVLSSRPATTAHHSAGPGRCVVSINRVDDVSRFMAELSPNIFVLDVKHLHLVAIAQAIAAIAKPDSVGSPVRPLVTVAGGLS